MDVTGSQATTAVHERDEKLSALLGALEVDAELLSVRDTDTTSVTAAGQAPGGDEKITVLAGASDSGGPSLAVGDTVSASVVDGGKAFQHPELLQQGGEEKMTVFSDTFVWHCHFDHAIAGVDKLSALVGGLECALPPHPVEDSDSDSVVPIAAGNAPVLTEGEDDKITTVVGVVGCRDPAFLVVDTNGECIVHAGTHPLFRYGLQESALYSNICEELGEHDIGDASICSSISVGAGSTEGERTATVDATDPAPPQGGVQNPEGVVITADASASSNADPAASHSGPGVHPPIPEVPVVARKRTWKAAVHRGRTTSLPLPSTQKLVVFPTPPKAALGKMIAELTEGGTEHISAFDVKGLVKGVPRGEPGDKAGEYCINGFAIDYYSTLLHEWQCAFSKRCQSSIFLKTHHLTKGKLSTVGYTLGDIIKKELRETMTMKLAVGLALMKVDIYTGMLTWEWLRLRCVCQDLHGPARAESGQHVLHAKGHTNAT
ncbi:hypothetical protein Cgig2_013518 [Carnegiea gigantea]|uniref:Uncharacterized protein n=1 Tax=Carnegiea gigantea TaxID=171969 RepID=A0A9Q1GMW5_9CARY|nr:hypothetical protein Cgig2_013518 [Carnegiea gigantea]